ncbi:Endo-1,4-beta-xylanase A precursor [Pelotomaculum schinkii]|uniref:Endo-1,4-beta-xylanase A n=1 Tax=Pelotomaculum schinkii TaxID=78350 RepID=A0A4Y7RG69_9FIRM|nr:S-layer homology domain-containing protein [Pelotomaculum schinkii]TEB08008.1 Endo-1,4-beta-xylanase A precursor [Pelotomaculum schinkii]
MINSRSFKLHKILAAVVGLSMVAGLLVMAVPRGACAAEPAALTVTGDGVEKEVTFTMADLQALPQKTYTYSGYNHWPALKVFQDMTGPSLQSILDVAGLKDNATLLRLKPAGGRFVHADFTREQLLEEPRYYFPEGENPGDLADWPPIRGEKGKTLVETIIALNDSQGRICFGQRAPNEPTGGDCVMIQEMCNGGVIEVLTAPLDQWEAPTADIPSGTVAPGTKVTLKKPDEAADNVMVYYTLDGSEPAYGSYIFNISYPSFRPELNKPVPVNGNLTIKAKTIGFGKLDSETATFQYNIENPENEAEGETAGTAMPALARDFADIAGHWARDEIKALAEKGIIDGVTATEFKPEEKITRAQFAKLLTAALNIKAEQNTGISFQDVPAGAWYHDYVAAAVQAGLIMGYSDDIFAPDDNITREQMAVIISRALKMKSTADLSHSVTEQVINKFKDKGDISPWAGNEIYLAVSCGIVSGLSEDTFAPQVTATRAETAAMILRLMRWSEEQ